MDYLTLIREKRKALGITQQQMADYLGIPRSTYNNIENKVIQLKINTFFEIIRILEIPVGMFLDKEDVMISKDDFVALKNSINRIHSIVDRVEMNNMLTHSLIGESMSKNKLHEISNIGKCPICGEPTGLKNLCPHHLEMKKEGKVVKNKNGYWVVKEI